MGMGTERVRTLLGSSPRYGDFHELFAQAGANVERSTGLLLDLMRGWPEDGNRRRLELKELEHEGDRVTHALMNHLNVRAATPFSTAQSHALISALDDVVDLAEEVGDFMGLYRIEAPTDQAVELARILRSAGSEIAVALGRLDHLGNLRRHAVAIDRLEEDGDRIQRQALTSLFEAGIDPMVVIRWKDIYERLEEGIDAAAHVGHALESLAVGRT